MIFEYAPMIIHIGSYKLLLLKRGAAICWLFPLETNLRKIKTDFYYRKQKERSYLMSKNINKAVVMGAGVMGASNRGLLASVGVQVVMLDIVPPKGLTDEEKAKGLTEQSYEFRNRFALAGIDKIKTPRNNMLYFKDAVMNVTPGNTTDNLDLIRDADWIVEAASENIAVKQSVFKQIEPYRKADAIVSSNTSGVSVHKIIDGLSEDLKKYFMGTHFFNPPRWMALFEMIATKWTDMDAYARMQDFAENTLGKVVVNAKDTRTSSEPYRRFRSGSRAQPGAEVWI